MDFGPLFRNEELGPDDYLYGRKGPWPQPSPDHPHGEAYAVIHLPFVEQLDWWFHVGLRYVVSLGLTPWMFLKAFFMGGLKPVSDQKFHEILTNTMMSKFITPKLDEEDYENFKELMKQGESYVITDLQAVRTVKAYKGLYVCPTKTLMREVGHEEYEVVGIYVFKTKALLTPEDGQAWELAKYFVLQGGAICATLVVHPNLHFPLDSINAITKTALPKKHILFKLLKPHLRFTLMLENAVLTFKTSVIRNKKWMSYAPYPGAYEGLRDLLVEGFRGIPGNESYPPYHFPLTPPKVYGKYGDFQNAYYEVIYSFVKSVLKNVKSDDVHVLNWADYIAHHVPGFPKGKDIFKGDTFYQCITSYIWSVTIGHSIDHYNYAQQSVQEIPVRLRQSPPKKGDAMISRKNLVTTIDQMKYLMCMKMFFGPTNVTRLIDCDYDFTGDHNKEYKKIVTEFKSQLLELEKKLDSKGLKYIPLNEIAASIQY
ncbi:lipoxygenase domain protein [Bacteriovorax sp. BSW11_IV]|uniref:lipoxygenase n=1 Tax=Bacteriovorax sp. BSW11_IV TaxID=1353529 RepID=UPI000389FD7A|nr:lipoxygenase [Bacteriovorax sp. BSW11_IV]EQC49229.1 lipoxygenase domain protein [Bacteriovorax sp. BSW11_IV]